MKRKIAIIGATGMLGSAVYEVLKEHFELLLVYRKRKNLNLLLEKIGTGKNVKTLQFNIEKSLQEYQLNPDNPNGLKRTNEFLTILNEYDYVINCSGIIKPFANKNIQKTLFVNSAFPHVLSRRLHSKLIQVSTDSVFDGITSPPYNEKSIKSPNDFYGLSKSLGEPESSLVMRTSFIGRDFNRSISLLEWVLSNKGKKIIGYENHLWNGLTTKEFGKVCLKIITDPKNFPTHGIYHIFSTTVTKYEIVSKINKKYGLGIKIEKRKVNPVDRRLTTIYSMNEKLKIADFDTMLSEL